MCVRGQALCDGGLRWPYNFCNGDSRGIRVTGVSGRLKIQGLMLAGVEAAAMAKDDSSHDWRRHAGRAGGVAHIMHKEQCASERIARDSPRLSCRPIICEPRVMACACKHVQAASMQAHMPFVV